MVLAAVTCFNMSISIQCQQDMNELKICPPTGTLSRQ